MADAPNSHGRRRFLTAATSVVGGVGVACVAVPFLSSWQPSAKAKLAAAPVEVPIGKMSVGQMVRVQWQGQPVYVVRRSQKVLDALVNHQDQLVDPHSEVAQQPDYATNSYRAINPEFLVVLGICTHLACAPMYIQGQFSEQVDGVSDGFFCPCHGSKFDMAGRVFENVPAPSNLVVPEHYYKDDNTLVIGVSAPEATTTSREA